MAYYGLTDTAIGPLLVAVEGDRLIAVKFGVDEAHLGGALDDLHHELHGAFDLEPGDAKVRAAAKQLQDYAAGKRIDFDLQVDLSWVTPFRREVLLECARIPRGQLATYADLARRVGRPQAFRAVGNTMRTNPVPLVVPCHRVVGSNGSLTGFGGGLDMKRQLLQLEGAMFA